LDAVIKRADEAMYEAKSKGRNKVVYKSRWYGNKNDLNSSK
jgi:PleD family two-component response regulator